MLLYGPKRVPAFSGGMMLKLLQICFGAALALFAASAPAWADIIEEYSLNDGSAGGFNCDPTSCGTVELDQATGNTTMVQVTVTLASGSDFISTGDASKENHPTFGFNITGDPEISVTGLTSGYTFDTNFNGGGNTYSASGVGTFDYAIRLTGTATNSLTFDVSIVGGGTLTVADFRSENTPKFIFVADIKQGSGSTGLVATNLPEPATPFFFGAGLLGLMAFGRRKPQALSRVR